MKIENSDRNRKVDDRNTRKHGGSSFSRAIALKRMCGDYIREPRKNAEARITIRVKG